MHLCSPPGQYQKPRSLWRTSAKSGSHMSRTTQGSPSGLGGREHLFPKRLRLLRGTRHPPVRRWNAFRPPAAEVRQEAAARFAAMRPSERTNKEWEQRCIGTHDPSTSARMIFRPRGSTDTSTPPARPRRFLMSPGGSRKAVPDIRDPRHLPRKKWDEKRIPIVSTSDGSALSQRWNRGLPRKPAGGGGGDVSHSARASDGHWE